MAEKRPRPPRRTPAQPRNTLPSEPTAVAAPAAEAAAGGRSAYQLKDEVVESALQTGEFGGLLEDYFGAEEYAELRQMAREAAARGTRGGPVVLILPGIMGSKLGKKGKSSHFDDVVWFDPAHVAACHLKDLALPGRNTGAVGVILLAYLKLKLRLSRAGYDARFHPFDWRRPVAESGRELKSRIDELGSRQVSIVAHGMGGLVARAAIGGGARCHRLVMLGTPNQGSFAPVMALRGTHPVVRKVAWLDRCHTAEELSRDVFGTFPGLTEMLPWPSAFSQVDLYDLASWPGAAQGLGPRKELLAAVAAERKELAGGGENVFVVAGVDQRTVVGVRLQQNDGGNELVYELSREGDGTVPLTMARLEGVKSTYYVAEAHGSLPNNRLVAAAVIDLLDRGATDVLPTSYTPAPERRAVELVPESQLRRLEPYEGRRNGVLSQRELRHVLEEAAAPGARTDLAPATAARAVTTIAAGAAPAGYRHPFDRVVVGRRRQHRIDLRFALGSITEADTRAIALGIFRAVAPTGAARAVDERLGGAVGELFQRRMFSGNVGEVFVLPTGRHPVTAEFVTFVGLGSFDRFGDEVLQTAAENIVRTFVSTRVEEFSTVLWGGGSGESPAGALRNLLTGFFRGLQDADRDHHFRRIVLCEQDPDRYVALKEEMYRLSSTALCNEVELTLDEVQLRPPLVVTPAPRQAVRRIDPVYLLVRQERETRTGEVDIRASLLTAGAKAAVIGGVRTLTRAEFTGACAGVTDENVTDLDDPGAALAETFLPEPVRVVLPRFRDHPLVVVHDAPMSRIPWEALRVGDNEPWVPAADSGLSHRYLADNLSVAKWLEQRPEDNVLTMLLVVNPTLDLRGAEEEGRRIREMFGGQAGVVLDELHGADATHPALLSAFSSGKYDVIHYAGHAFFDEKNPERSGLLAHNKVHLTGADLAGLGNLPSLVFFNACESGRVRTVRTAGKRTTRQVGELSRAEHLQRSVGLAEAFMRGGVANLIGTYWPVGDASATSFARTFYRRLLAGDALGDALLAGRKALLEIDSKDWADYILYGNPDFVLKMGAASGA